MGRQPMHQPSPDNSAFFENCGSEELEIIIKRTVFDGGAEDAADPGEEVSIDNHDRSLRMSFGRWTTQDKATWACPDCTYVNAPLHLTCAVCGKARGHEEAMNASTSSQHTDNSWRTEQQPIAPVQESFVPDDYDPFLEQLQRERHAEVMELQQNILKQAALDLSVKSETSGRGAQNQYQQSSTYSTNTNTNTPKLEEEDRDSIFDNLSDKEAMELRKILNMNAGNSSEFLQSQRTSLTDSTVSTSASYTSANNYSRTAQQQQQQGMDDSVVSMPERGTRTDYRQRNNYSSSSANEMDRSLPARPRQSRRQQQGGRLASVIDDYDDVAGDDIMDDDILAKLAARSHGPPPGRRANRPSATCNADDDMPDLTGMTSSVNSSSTTTSQPGERPWSTASPRPNGAAGGSEVSVTNRVRRVTSGEDIDADTLIKIAASRGRTSTPHVQQSHTSTKSPARSPTRARPNSATRGNGVTRGRFPKNTPRERSPLRPNGASGEYETSLTNRVRRVQSGEDIDEDTLIKIAASRGRGPFPEHQSHTSAQSPERSPYQARPRSRSPASRGTVSPRSPKKRVLRVLSGDDMDDIDADTMIKIAEASGRGPIAPVQQSPSSPKRSPVRARGVSPDERSISPTPPVRVPPPSQNRGRSFGGPDLDEDIMIKIAAASGSQATTRQTADVAERATSLPLTEATSADEATSDNGGGEGDFGLEVIDASCSFHCEEKTHDQNGLILDAPPVKTGGKGSKVSLKKAAKGLLKQFRKKKQ